MFHNSQNHQFIYLLERRDYLYICFLFAGAVGAAADDDDDLH